MLTHGLKSLFFTLLVFTISVFSPGAEKLTSKSADWTLVMSGKSLCQPCQTSYGFAVLTDAKMISACTDSGHILWERSVTGRPEPILSSFSSDFLLTVSNQNYISLINPSGLTLWTKETDFVIKNNPIVGRDCRIFIKGEQNLACFGLNGICKWTIETPVLRSENLFEMNDGSLLSFLQDEQEGKTCALRISPFGEIIETITFSGKILSALSVNSGLLLYFSDGSAGMCHIRENKAKTKWTIPFSNEVLKNAQPDKNAGFVELSGEKAVLAAKVGEKTLAVVFSIIDGKILNFFLIPESIKNKTLLKSDGELQKIFLSGNKKAFLYSSDGNVIWNAEFSDSGDEFSNLNHIFLTKNNNLILCSSEWAIAGYKISQNVSKKSVQKKNPKKNYESFFNKTINAEAFLDFSETLPESMSGKQRNNEISEGNYGSKETEYLSGLSDFCISYRNYLTESASRPSLVQKSIFERDTKGVESAIFQLNSLGIDAFINDLAVIIKTEKNTGLLTAALKAVCECAFDPDSTILKAIDYRLKILPCYNDAVFVSLCDSIFEICRFMGRPAFYDYGMEILTVLLRPQYSSTVRDYARITLTRIAKLKI